jgi:hypothetical protein
VIALLSPFMHLSSARCVTVSIDVDEVEQKPDESVTTIARLSLSTGAPAGLHAE